MKPPKLFAASWLFAALNAWGNPIDIGGQEQIRVPAGATITVDFGIWTYAWHNPGGYPYPAHLEFEALGIALQNAGTLAVPGTTLAYFPAWTFQGQLESLDGSITVPLVDANASRLGLTAGTLAASVGEYSSGGREPCYAAVVSAWADLTPELSAALFASSYTNYSDAARIRLRNTGDDFTLGIGQGYLLRQAIQEPALRGGGPVETAGVTGAVGLETPEPATWTFALGTLLALPAFFGARRFKTGPDAPAARGSGVSR